MNREVRKQQAQATLAVLQTGSYEVDGETIDIKAALQAAITGSTLYRPSDEPRLIHALETYPRNAVTTIKVTDCTTLQAASQLSSMYQHVAVLNFASARNPGGGFEKGSQAQEESLARSSGLYATLIEHMEMYHHNRRLSGGEYADYMIWSPHVPVFRNDSGHVLSTPYHVSFITAPAVNAGVFQGSEAQVREITTRRAHMIWSIAAEQGCDALILGAWGCGVFRNNPALIAEVFQQLHQAYDGLFKHIEYAIYDTTANKDVLHTFENIG